MHLATMIHSHIQLKNLIKIIITLIERRPCMLTLVQMLSLAAAQTDPALAGHVALMLSS